MLVAFVPKVWEAFRTFLPALAFSFFSRDRDWSELVFALIGVFGGFGAIAAYLTTRFGVQDGQLVCTSGWLFKRDRRIPLDQVQNVNIRQGLLDRLFNVVTIEVETAAGSGAELKLQVLSQTDADKFRQELVSGAVPRSTEEHALPAYRISRSDMLLGALTENHGLQLLLALLPLIGAGAVASFLDVGFALNQFVPSWLVLLTVGAAVTALVFLGWIVGAISYVLRYSDFTVQRETELYRISHGLLTKVQHVIRQPRIEFAAISSTPWQRWVGRCSLHVGTAGSFGEQGGIAPLALMMPIEKSASVLESVLPGTSIGAMKWNRLPSYYLRVLLVGKVLGAIPASALAVVLLAAELPRMASLMLSMLLSILVVAWIAGFVDAILRFRITAYASNEHILALRQGFFKQTLSVLPLDRVEVVSLMGYRWWPRRGVTVLSAQAMVHQIQVPMASIVDAQGFMLLWRSGVASRLPPASRRSS